MTKKHFIALADMIRDTKKRYENGAVTAVPFTQEQICDLADFCESQNPNFNRDLWRSYIAGKCGPNGGARRSG
jgi:hypothetical protein